MDALNRLTDAIARGDVKSVIAVVGAGISVAAGIPDFRSPGTGLYDNLARFRLPFPEAVFDVTYFKGNPKPFFRLARALWPGRYVPTRTHHFLRLLADKGLLTRVYSQNIDMLERRAGVPAALLVEAHGSFATSTCTRCRARYDLPWLAEAMRIDEEANEGNAGVVDGGRAGRRRGAASPVGATTGGDGNDGGGGSTSSDDDAASDGGRGVVVPTCDACGGVVKPDVVFYGEELPPRFHALYKRDVAGVDAVLVLGTSLQVYPVAGLPAAVRRGAYRVVLNNEPLWGPRSGYDYRRHAVDVAARLREGGGGARGSGGGAGSATPPSSSSSSTSSPSPSPDASTGSATPSPATPTPPPRTPPTPPGPTTTSALGRFVPLTDVMLAGPCDDGVTLLARALGWEDQLDALQAGWVHTATSVASATVTAATRQRTASVSATATSATATVTSAATAASVTVEAAAPHGGGSESGAHITRVSSSSSFSSTSVTVSARGGRRTVTASPVDDLAAAVAALGLDAGRGGDAGAGNDEDGDGDGGDREGAK